MAPLERVMFAMAELPFRGIGFPAARLWCTGERIVPFYYFVKCTA